MSNYSYTPYPSQPAPGPPAERTKRGVPWWGWVLIIGGITMVLMCAGVIGFVGLMTPHLLRLLVGADHRRLLPAVLLGGPLFVVLADLAARTVLAPEELPLGAVTALVGAPFFLWLLRHERGKAVGVA